MKSAFHGIPWSTPQGQNASSQAPAGIHAVITTTQSRTGLTNVAMQHVLDSAAGNACTLGHTKMTGSTASAGWSHATIDQPQRLLLACLALPIILATQRLVDVQMQVTMWVLHHDMHSLERLFLRVLRLWRFKRLSSSQSHNSFTTHKRGLLRQLSN